MNAFNSCDGTAIFIRWEMKCSIQLGFASLNRTFHLSPHENIRTIALITIHYLYTIGDRILWQIVYNFSYYNPLNIMAWIYCAHIDLLKMYTDSYHEMFSQVDNEIDSPFLLLI